jgi:hypothetical protein
VNDEAKLHSDASRAIRAQQLMDDELFNEALANLEADYITAWKASLLRDTEARERLWQAVQIVGKIKGHFELMVQSGKLAKKQLDEIAQMGERKKIFGVV